MYRIHSNIHIIDGNAFLINKIRINFSFWKVKFVSTKGVHTRSGPETLTNPPDANPISDRTETPVDRQQVSDSKNQRQWVKWQVASPKPEQPKPDRAI